MGDLRSKDGDAEIVDTIETFFFETFPPTVTNVRRYERGELHLAIADVERFGSNSRRGPGVPGHLDAAPGRWAARFGVLQTVALYTSPHGRFPTFTLQPTSEAATSVAGGVGVGKIELRGHAAFTAAYHLMSVRDDAVRALFTGELLDSLAPGNELWVAAEHDSLLAYRTGRFLAEEERERLADEAAAVFGRIEASALRLAEAEARARDVPRPQGVASRRASEIHRRSQRGTLAEVEAWAATDPPRRPTLWMFQYIDRLAPLLGLAVVSVFLLVGTMWFVSAGTDAEGRLKPWVELAPLFPVAFMACLGGLGFIGMGFRIIQIVRVLCFGILREATIIDIHDVSMGWGDSIPKAVKVSFSTTDGPVEASAPLTHRALTRAKRLRAAGERAQILVANGNPRRILFVGALPSVHPDFD